MLPRILEPEVMDSHAEAIDYDSMDHAEVNRRFVADFLHAVGEPAGCNMLADVLDLGTGTAQIPIELCRTAPEARVLAIDLAESMLEVGRRNVVQAELASRIELARVDAKQLPYPARRFTAVISNSIVHHIPEPRHVLAEAVRVLAPGGLLFFRDLMRPTHLETVLRFVDMYAAGANRHQRQMFESSLRAALSLDEIRTMIGELGRSPDSVEATSDRHWTISSRY